MLKTKLAEIHSVKNYNFSTRQDTIEAIKAEYIAQGIGVNTQIDYVVSTAEW